MSQTIVVKIGGSLLTSVEKLLKELKELSRKRDLRIVIIPGGGIFADTVRRFSSYLSDDAAHTMAILAMDQYGIYLSDVGRIRMVDRFEDLDGSRGVTVLLLSQIMREHDPLPHTWDVTSDTIGAWVAAELGAMYIKMTDVDGIFLDGKRLEVVPAHKLKELRRSCTDPALPDFLIARGMNCIVLNGRYPERLWDLIEERPFKGTVIRGVGRDRS